MNLFEWRKTQDLRGSKADQVSFLLYEVTSALELGADQIQVLGTHPSKSFELPVCEVCISGVRVVFRGNFHNWMVSVDAPFPIELDAEWMFDPDQEEDSVFCEGFSEDDVFGSYTKNNQQFTVCLETDCRLCIVLTRLCEVVRLSS